MNGNKAPTSVNVLGTEYKIIYSKRKDDPKMEDRMGYIEFFSKEIYINNQATDELTVKNFEILQEKTVRHEIIHAFLFESGLDSNCEWANNEEMIDFFALQFDKINKAINSTKEVE